MNRRPESGMTLTEVIIVLALLAILAVIGGSVVRSCRSAGPVTTEAALKFARDMGEPEPRATCVDYDTDGDGYVSCTVFRKDKDPLAIECAGGWTQNTGCRLARILNSNQ